MQQENQELRKKLIIAERDNQALLQMVKALQTCVESSQETRDMLAEWLAYYEPNTKIGFEWKRVYLPVYGKINSPPFSKN